jgi:hypothetical protein
MVTASPESLIVDADMTALGFHEAAWEARDQHGPPPDASALSDRALYTVLRYPEPDLPSEAREALRDECRRRGIMTSAIEAALGVALLAFLAIAGLVIGWLLFA